MGVTAFATAFFPGLTLTQLALLASMIVEGQPASKYIELLTPQLVSYSVVVAVPCILGLFLFFFLLYIISTRLCGCGSKRCRICLKCSSCCFVVQIISCIVGLAGCVGLIIASTQPLIGFTNASKELQTLTEKLDVVTKSAVAAGDSILDALLVFSNGTKLGSSIDKMLGMDSQQLSAYITDLSTNSLIGPVYKAVVLSDNGFASSVSSLLTPNCNEVYKSIDLVEDFASHANTNLKLIGLEDKQKAVIDDLQTRKTYSYFENTSSTNNIDDVKITTSSLAHLNRKSIVGGAVYALNSVVMGVNNSLEPKTKAALDIAAQWKVIIEEASKQVFSSDEAYNKYKASQDNPIPRTDLKLPASRSAADITNFIKTHLDKLGNDENDKKLIKAILETFTTGKTTIGSFIKAICTSDLKNQFTNLCNGITDSSTDTDISSRLNSLIIPTDSFTNALKDMFDELGKLIPYVSYVQELQLHREQMEPRYVFDAFVNNETCPYFISGLVPLLHPGTTITTCTPEFMKKLPSWVKSYTTLTLAFPLVTAFILLFPLVSFTMGLLGAFCKKKSLLTWAMICNASSILCVAILLAIFGLLAVIIGKVFVVQASALFNNPEKYMDANYPQIMSIINASIPEEYKKVFISNVSIDLMLNSEKRSNVFPTLVYTTPSCIPIDWSTYAALKATGKDDVCTSSLGAIVDAATELSLPTDDPLRFTGLSFPLNFSTFSLTNLIYYNKKSWNSNLLQIMGLPEFYLQLKELLPNAATALLTLGSIFVNSAEKVMVNTMAPVIKGISDSLNKDELKKINLFLQAKDGYALYATNYSSEDMKSMLYGSSASSELFDIYKVCTSYVQSYTGEQKPNALSLRGAVAAMQELNGIKGECIALTQLLRGVAFAVGCELSSFDQTITYTAASSLDALCAKEGIAAFMKNLRTALNALKTSCSSYTDILIKVLNKTMEAEDVRPGCQKGDSTSNSLANEKITRTYPAFAEAIMALLPRGLTIFGWNTSITKDDAFTRILDTTRAYQRFTDVFNGWQAFNTDTVAFINAYSDLISGILSPITIFSDILETNMIATNHVGRLTPGFSSCFDKTVMTSLRALINDTMLIPINRAVAASLDAAIGDKGLITPYTWEAVFLLVDKLLFGVGMLESFGAIFLCLYFIWAGFFFGVFGQNNSWILFSHASMGPADDNSERVRLMPSVVP
ncbi:Hypothetical protein GLP15_3599 [Giardia lamblia P15]|uniref:Uncharacterized protein n=1 Tax=Giardia intestinalis (strain P15) TaxID=658858 RepID=E1F4E6_GIAIA|nr:Hypothetical protein GLP15_3599 [Giardia lamblia P15]